MDHYANPRHWGRLEAPDIVGDADNPSCGDQVRFELALDGDERVCQVAFAGWELLPKWCRCYFMYSVVWPRV